MPTPRRGTSIERDNPFRPGGDIEKEADEVLRNSTISSERVSIVDPSSPQYKKTNGSVAESPLEESADNDQVVVSLNSTPVHEHDSGEGKDTKHNQSPKCTTPGSEQGNGHTANTDTVDGNTTPDGKLKKTKKKKQKTCQII